MKETKVPVWKPSMCNPLYTMEDELYSVEIGPNKITTLEGTNAGLPTIGSSGVWGDSGKTFTDMEGTPIGADVIYFSNYEDKFYRLKINFDVEFMKKVILEKNYNEEEKVNIEGEDRGTFSGLIFGFAPQGMVVVWRAYGVGSFKIEIGRYQAEVAKNDKELEKKMFPPEGMSRKKVVEMYVMPQPVTCEKWDRYRKRYNLKIETVSENKGFKLFESRIENYNGEFLFEFRPEILQQTYTSKALPKRIIVNWETGLNQSFQGNIFFNEKTIFEKFNNVKPNENQNLQIKIATDNSVIEVLLNNEPLKMDSIRIWKINGDKVYKDSYK